MKLVCLLMLLAVAGAESPFQKLMNQGKELALEVVDVGVDIAKNVTSLLHKEFHRFNKILQEEKGRAKEDDRDVWEGFEKKLHEDLKRFLQMILEQNFTDISKSFPGFRILEETIIKVNDHNKEYEAGNQTFRLRIHEHSDMSFEEYSQKMLGYRPDPNDKNNSTHKRKHSVCPKTRGLIKPRTMNNYVDWRERNVVTPVKNQKSCGSCWAFGVTATLESHWAIKGHKLVDLSPQDLVDCIQKPNPILPFLPATQGGGCSGSDPKTGWKYIQGHGINKERDYPYEARNGECRHRNGDIVTINSWEKLPTMDEGAIQDVVENVGPVLVTLQATFNFMHYDGRKGSDGSVQILDDFFCVPGIFSRFVQLGNHAVTIVGFGNDPMRGDYWIIKNSHGQKWGDHGYFYLRRGRNMCSVSKNPSYPVV